MGLVFATVQDELVRIPTVHVAEFAGDCSKLVINLGFSSTIFVRFLSSFNV